MKMSKPKINKACRSGFSLVEVLLVVSVIGIMAAIAIPYFGNTFGAATSSTARRNAQTLSSTFAAARAAGVNIWDSSSTAISVEADLDQGVSPTDGPFQGKRFAVPGLPAPASSEYTAMMSYLTWDSSNLQLDYNPGF